MLLSHSPHIAYSYVVDKKHEVIRICDDLGLFFWLNFWSRSLCLRYTKEPNGPEKTEMEFVMVGDCKL